MNNKQYSPAVIKMGKISRIIIFGILAIFIFAVVVSVISFNEKRKAENDNNNTELTEEIVSDYCIDASITGKYIPKNVTTVKISGTPSQFGDFDGWYDEKGNSIKYYRWSGKNKDTGEEIRFDCWVSGKSKDDLSLHYFALNSAVPFDTRTSTVVDQDGKHVFSDTEQ